MGKAIAAHGFGGSSFRFIPLEGPFRRAFLLGLILSLFQALDGIFTSMGVSRFGVEIEGNPLLRGLMEEFGHLPVLGVFKLLAVVVIAGLVLSAKKITWVNNAMGALSCVYLFAAILPWTYILFLQPILTN